MQTLSFKNTSIACATKHQKARAAREPFERILRSTVEELEIDSDRLGTFSGEEERSGSMLDALRGKIVLARAISPARFIMVSEGSFGVGGFGILPSDVEMLLLHDADTGVEIVEQFVSWDTNYATATLTKMEELAPFLSRISFGSHALVLYPGGRAPISKVCKGITSLSVAEEAFSQSLAASPLGTVVAMSDMRAHLNPTRMRAITSCCELLAQRLATLCPCCGSGGFGLVESIPGLPCSWCGSPTSRARAERHACPVCGKSSEKPRSDGVVEADPGVCHRCNP